MDGSPTDATLLLAVVERDVGALRSLYGRHAGWLALRLARRCNDRDLVADAVSMNDRTLPNVLDGQRSTVARIARSRVP
jgi:hypothetical protein